MLSYFLSITIVIASLNLYLSAFIRPKIHRRDDFLWSGLGLFYGLILWICAGRITGAILLSQLAIVTVAIAFMWENVSLRKAWLTDEKNTLEGFSVLNFVLNTLGKFSKSSKKKEVIFQEIKEKKTIPSEEENFPEIAPEIKEALDKVEEEEITQFSEVTTNQTEEKASEEIVTNDSQEESEENSPLPSSVEKEKDSLMVSEGEDKQKDSLVVNEEDKQSESPQKKGFFRRTFGSIFGGKKKKTNQEININREDEEIGDNFIDNPEEDSNDRFFSEEESKSNSSQDISTVLEEDDSDLPIDEKTLAECSPDEQIILDDEITDLKASADDDTVLEKSSTDDEKTVLEEVSADEEETVLLETSAENETLLEDNSFDDDEEENSTISPDMEEEKESISTQEEVDLKIPTEDTINSFDDVTNKLKGENVNNSDNWDFSDDEEEKKEDESKDETVDDILDELDKND